MPERLRFHLDEHIDPVIAAALRQYGIDVTTTVGAALRGESDEAQIAFVRRESRVLVTSDADFLRYASDNSDHPGIAFIQPGRRPLGEIIHYLILMYEVLSSEEIAGRVEFI